MQTKKSICMWCHSHCPVVVYVKEGRLEGFDVDREHPHWRLYEPIVQTCPRRARAKEWFYHPSRLKYPLKRRGERGSGAWEQISWSQALDEIAEKLKEIIEEYGPEAIATTRGTGRTHDEYRARFFCLLGSPNIIGATEVCFGPSLAVSNAIIGWMPWPLPRRGLTKCILVMGCNQYSYPNVWRLFYRAQKAGAKLIVVDPRYCEAARRADLWLQVRPGTDAALLLAMINIIIKEKLYDEEFVEKWCYGFHELTEHIKTFTPEWASEITEVPAEDIVKAARIYAKNKPACSFSGMGIEHQPNAIQTLHLRFILPALTGNLDINGGDVLSGPYMNAILEQEVQAWEHLSEEQKRKQLGSDRFKLLSWQGYELIQGYVKKAWGKTCAGVADACTAHTPTLYRAVLTGKPYPVKALITVASHPLTTQPNTKLIYEAIKKLELYVVHELFMTPCAMLADYVLPAASWLERPYLYNGFGFGKFLMGAETAVPPMIKGEYERKTDFELWRELGVRLGQEENWPWKTLEEAYDDRLKPLGLTFKEFMAKGRWDSPPTEFKKYEKIGFGTSTGKVELYSTIFERLGYSPLPSFIEPPESPKSKPETAKEYPYILITGGRFLPYYHSEWRQLKSLRKIRPNPIVQIHPETAKKHDIKDGEWIWIETPRGKIKQKCKYFEGIKPNVIHVEHGWWFPEEEASEPNLFGVWKANANILTEDNPDNCDPIGGIWPLRTGLCKIYKV